MLLRVALLFCVLVAVRANEEDDCCSHDDRMAVLNSWETIWSPEYLYRRITIAQEVFSKFFELAPDAKPIFEHVNVENPDSDEFIAHCVRVMAGVDLLINLAYNPDILHEELKHLGAQHAQMSGVTVEHFELFRQALEHVLPQAIPCFDGQAFERCIAIDHHYIERMLPQ